MSIATTEFSTQPDQESNHPDQEHEDDQRSTISTVVDDEIVFVRPIAPPNPQVPANVVHEGSILVALVDSMLKIHVKILRCFPPMYFILQSLRFQKMELTQILLKQRKNLKRLKKNVNQQ